MKKRKNKIKKEKLTELVKVIKEKEDIKKSLEKVLEKKEKEKNIQQKKEIIENNLSKEDNEETINKKPTASLEIGLENIEQRVVRTQEKYSSIQERKKEDEENVAYKTRTIDYKTSSNENIYKRRDPRESFNLPSAVGYDIQKLDDVINIREKQEFFDPLEKIKKRETDYEPPKGFGSEGPFIDNKKNKDKYYQI